MPRTGILGATSRLDSASRRVHFLHAGEGLVRAAMTWTLALLLRPFAALVLFGLICLPARLLVQQMPNCWLRRLLLLEITKTANRRGPRRDPLYDWFRRITRTK